VIRPAHANEAEQIADVERHSWPAALAMDAARIRSRLAKFPAGQLVLELDGEVVAYAAAQRASAEFFAAHRSTFASLTDHGSIAASHVDDGEIYHLIGVGVAPAGRGARVSRKLVDQQIANARNLPGVRRILGVTRPVGLHRQPDIAIEEYVKLRRDDGGYVDPMLAFHLGTGAKLVEILPAYRPEDVEALGYGVLIEYPVNR